MKRRFMHVRPDDSYLDIAFEAAALLMATALAIFLTVFVLALVIGGALAAAGAL